MFIKIVFIYLFLFLIESVLNFIVIEFKTHNSLNSNENTDIYNNDFNSSDFLKNYYLNKIFFPIEVSSPSKEVPFILKTTTSGLNIGYSICPLFNFTDLPHKYLEYSTDNSSTYNLTSKNMKSISNGFTGSQSSELFKFYTDLEKKASKQVIIKELPFIYLSINDINKEYNDGTVCGLIGLALFERNSFFQNYNLISLLKEYRIIDNYVFNFEYNYNNNDDEGLFVIGEMPHNYNSKKFNEEQLKTDYCVKEYFDFTWGLNFNSIYFLDEEKNKIILNDIKYAEFIPELYCIKGTTIYKKLIEENFFNFYINKNICRFDIETLILPNKDYDKYYIMNCDINSELKIENFPTLYFVHKKFNYTFELNYNDLFIKKGNKYFFMVIFPYLEMKHFEMGKIFLKKYFFSYDIDRKTISFYNENIPIEKINNKNKEKSYLKYLIIAGIIFLVISCVIGFYFGKKIYEKSRNKRKNELEEDYDYSLNH